MILKKDLIKYSFSEKNIPHFAKTGIATINKICNHSIEIIIDKHQKYSDTSIDGKNIDSSSGITLNSIFENDKIVVFKIPSKYIWCVLHK